VGSGLSVNPAGISLRLILMAPVLVFVGAIALADGYAVVGVLLMALGVLSFVVAACRLRRHELSARQDGRGR